MELSIILPAINEADNLSLLLPKLHEVAKGIGPYEIWVVDGGWGPAGFAAEVIGSVIESAGASALMRGPLLITLPVAPAPASRVLESTYYPTLDTIVAAIRQQF